MPSRHRPVKTQQGVVVGQAALFDLDMGGRSDDVEPLAAQQFGRFDMLGITDRLVFGPDPGVIGDLVALTADLDSPQVGGDLDAPTDRDRVHRHPGSHRVGLSGPVCEVDSVDRPSPAHQDGCHHLGRE